jgi:acetyl/propionyl-CoA carboxylase alpha subunit
VRRIGKLLVANRGEIARRVFRTCRRLGIPSVAVFSDPDATEPHVREADEAVPLGGATPADSYLRIDALLDAAARTGADAVHPGYGFLAESAEFARRCSEAGLVFVGPSPEVIAAMGSKIEAKARMEKAGVPVIPGALLPESGVADEVAGAVGYPLLVKASAGGGGKGMRIVREAAGLERALEAARREAAAAFGDDTLFLERYLEAPRHVEIQIFGDASGRVVHLYERECSIQRRHQKILEESPSVAVDPELRAAMGAAAVTAGEALGYVGAGTVEFLLDGEGRFYFLEVNTRLQVEHPVTECITGLDLVALQLDVAEGASLMPQEQIGAPRGHAIEVRLYAEDPERGFLPSIGPIHRFEVGDDGNVRVDSGIESGSTVGIHYDPLLAKLIAHGPTRAAAARRLASALERGRLHGPRTNRDLLVRILRHDEFLEGHTDTHFLERHDPGELGRPLVSAAGERVHAVAAALAAQAQRREAASVLGSLPSGWRNNPSALQEVELEGRHGRASVGYRVEGDEVAVRLDAGELRTVRVARCTSELVELAWEGVLRRCVLHRVGDLHYVDSALGASELRELERFPVAADAAEAGSLTAPMPGVVRVVRVRAGDLVRAGDVLLVLEAMKMEHDVVAGADGRVLELDAQEGQQVDAGQILAVLAEDEGGAAE